MKRAITSSFILRLRAVLAATLLLLPLASKAQFSGSGTGTENDPYLIFNAIQLAQVRNFLNKSVYFKLMADIDLTDWIADNSPSQGWLPIGNVRRKYLPL